jgi:hypothetical protein
MLQVLVLEFCTDGMLQLRIYYQFQGSKQEIDTCVLPFQPFKPFWSLTQFFFTFLEVIYYRIYQVVQEFSKEPSLQYRGGLEN